MVMPTPREHAWSRAGSWRRLALPLVVLLALLTSASAFAQSRQDKAREQFEKGRQLYAERKFDEALEALMGAYVLDPNPVLVYNIARIHEDKDDLENAVRFFENYLKISPKARDRVAVKKRIAALQKVIKTRPPRGYLSLESVPFGGTVRVDGLVVGQTPLSAVPLTAGRHAVSVQLDGYDDWTSDIAVTGGRTLQLTAPLKDRPSPTTIDTMPPGAEATLLTSPPQPLGRCPCSVLLSAGTHTIRVTALGHREKLQTLEKRPGEPLAIRVTLDAEQATGELDVTSVVPGGRLRIDGQDAGSLPLPGPVLLKAGVVVVEVAVPGHEPHVERVVIPAGGRASLIARPRPLGGGGATVVVGDEGGSGLSTGGYALIGVGSAAVAAAIALHVVALWQDYDFESNGDYKRDPATGLLLRTDITRLDAFAAEETAKKLELGAIIAYSIGGSALLAGIIMAAIDTDSDLEVLGGVTPSFMVTPSGVSFGLNVDY